MTEFAIKGVQYRAGKMDAMAQFHVVRRLSPVIGGLRDMITRAVSGQEQDLVAAVQPLAEAIAHMSDEDSEFIIGKCMSVTQRQESKGSGWANIWSENAKQPMFADIDMGAMIFVCVHVLKANLGPFIDDLRQTLNAGDRKN